MEIFRNHIATAARSRASGQTPPPGRYQRRSPEDWFTPWFNSPYYHALYQNRDEQEARFFMDRVIRLLDLGGTSKVLDLGCGRGRHAVYLSSTGADVTGLDIACESIEYARRYQHDRLRFFVGDMREAYGEQAFSDILNLFTSFGYFACEDDNLNVVRQAARALRPGGRILIDFLNAEKVMGTLVPHEIKRVQTTRFEIVRRLEAGFIVKDIYVSDLGTTDHFQERVQALLLENFLSYFQAAGLCLMHVFGDYALNPFQASTSDRLIMVAQKSSTGRL